MTIAADHDPRYHVHVDGLAEAIAALAGREKGLIIELFSTHHVDDVTATALALDLTTATHTPQPIPAT